MLPEELEYDKCTPDVWNRICDTIDRHQTECPKLEELLGETLEKVKKTERDLTLALELNEKYKAKNSDLKKENKDLIAECNEQQDKIDKLEEDNDRLRSNLESYSTKYASLKKRKGGTTKINDRRDEAKEDVKHKIRDYVPVVFRKRKFFRSQDDIDSVCDELFGILEARHVQTGCNKLDFKEIYSAYILDLLGNRRQYVQTQGLKAVRRK